MTNVQIIRPNGYQLVDFKFHIICILNILSLFQITAYLVSIQFIKSVSTLSFLPFSSA